MASQYRGQACEIAFFKRFPRFLQLINVGILGHVFAEALPLRLQGWRHILVYVREEILHRRFRFPFRLAQGIKYRSLFFLDNGLDFFVADIVVFVELQEFFEAIERIALLSKMFDLIDTTILRGIVARADLFCIAKIRKVCG